MSHVKQEVLRENACAERAELARSKSSHSSRCANRRTPKKIRSPTQPIAGRLRL